MEKNVKIRNFIIIVYNYTKLMEFPERNKRGRISRRGIGKKDIPRVKMRENYFYKNY